MALAKKFDIIAPATKVKTNEMVRKSDNHWLNSEVIRWSREQYSR